MKLSAFAMLATLSLSLAGIGCGAGADASSETILADEAELQTPSFAGTYSAKSDDDDHWFFANTMQVTKSGSKFVVEIDGTSYDMRKTTSGAYVFTSGDLDGECDDVGCSYVTKVSGVLYLKKVGSAKKPTLKLTIRENHPYPEYEGDLDGETTSTFYWVKKR